MKAAFIIDSTASLPDNMKNLPNVMEVELSVRFPDGEVFGDTTDIAESKRFYNKLETSEELPSSSQPQPVEFYRVCDRLVEEGYDTVFGIFLSSKISGTLQTAHMILEEYADHFNSYIIDSKGTSIQMLHILKEGMAMVEEGRQPEAIAEEMQWIADNSRVYVMLKDLKNIVKGGRATSFQAALSTMLRVFVILYFNEAGEVVLFDKVRTKRKVIKRYIELVQEAKDRYPAGLKLAFAHGNAPEEVKEFEQAILAEFPDLDYMTTYLTPVLGTHGGQGCIGMGTLACRRPQGE
ncbi:DegV family protein [Aerococcus sp. Group 1]|uniref:DegV family protein n=1 Tax=Aerococcus urinae (strain CCUG 59500 / ACS-120-V-Col10a) TaxID=2976812 RepID=UPI00227C46CF|nr:DegV family protein [Aerococcus sp. Group 1]MCY3030994.1 DegV family protein [Aerococcus sp. Group 1]